VRPRFTGLWRHPDFLKLWAGQTISLIGTQVTLLALPLTAALVLGATPFEVGVLGAVGSAPYLLFGLLAGVWVDRLSRRPVMIGADIGRAVLLASIPAAALMGLLRLEHLYAVAFGVGVLSLFFRVAYGAFLPSVVRRQDLPEGNARMALSEAVARVAGPGLGGGLVQLLTAPLAIVVDAVSFVGSALCLARIRAPETPPTPRSEAGNVWNEAGEGLWLVARDPYLRPLIGVLAVGNLGDGLLFSSGVHVLYTTRDLRIEPAMLGGVLSAVGFGGLAGAALSGPVTRRLGMGAALLLGVGLWGCGYSAMAVIHGSPLVAAILLALVLAAVGTVNPIAGVNAVSLLQAITPPSVLGRVTATGQFVAWSAITLGALAGGALAGLIGLRATVAVSGLLPLLGFAWLFASPVRAVRDPPKPTHDVASAVAKAV
jgi:MFS family permease